MQKRTTHAAVIIDSGEAAKQTEKNFWAVLENGCFEQTIELDI